MATTGFTVNGTDIAQTWPDKSYLIDRYPELADSLRQAGLWTWGYGVQGQLGDNTTTTRSSPVQTIASGTNWRLVAAGKYHTVAIKTDGTLWLWGLNGGALGNNDTANQSSPVQTVSGGTNWKIISASESNTAAIKTDGTLWLWGSNNYGKLGNNNTTSVSSPIQTVAGGTNWRQISCGRFHTAAVKTDGTLWLWGRNVYGELGTNNTTNRSSPVQTVASGTNWKQVSCGWIQTSAIKTDGTLWTWGWNNNGQLGNNDTTNRSSPVQTVASGTNWKQVSSSAYKNAAIKTDGTLWLWGSNSYGQLGNNNTTSVSSPIQTVAGGTNWKSVDAEGYLHVAAIRDDSSDAI